MVGSAATILVSSVISPLVRASFSLARFSYQPSRSFWNFAPTRLFTAILFTIFCQLSAMSSITSSLPSANSYREFRKSSNTLSFVVVVSVSYRASVISCSLPAWSM